MNPSKKEEKNSFFLKFFQIIKKHNKDNSLNETHPLFFNSSYSSK